MAGFIFAPAAEPESEDAVFTGRSHEVLKQQKSINNATYLVGLNSLEGKFFANCTLNITDPIDCPDSPLKLKLPISVLNLLRMYLLTFDVLPTRLVPVDMNVASKETERTVAMQLQKEYFPNELVTFSDKNLLKFLSDDQFVRPIAEYVRLLSQARNCYMYLFTYEGDLGGDDRSNNGNYSRFIHTSSIQIAHCHVINLFLFLFRCCSCRRRPLHIQNVSRCDEQIRNRFKSQEEHDSRVDKFC